MILLRMLRPYLLRDRPPCGFVAGISLPICILRWSMPRIDCARQYRINDRIDVAAVFSMLASSSATVLASTNARYSTLPVEFKIFAPPTGDRVCDIFQISSCKYSSDHATTAHAVNLH